MNLPDAFSFLAILLSAFLAGTLLFTQLGLVPAMARLPATAYVHYHREISLTADRFMPLACAAATGTTALLAWLRWREAGASLSALLVCAGLLGVASVTPLTVAFNLPFNKAMVASDPEHPPHDWAAGRARWNRFNVVRTWTVCLGFCALVAGELLAGRA